MNIYVILHVFPGTPDPPELIGAYESNAECLEKLYAMGEEGIWGEEGVDYWYDTTELELVKE